MQYIFFLTITLPNFSQIYQWRNYGTVTANQSQSSCSLPYFTNYILLIHSSFGKNPYWDWDYPSFLRTKPNTIFFTIFFFSFSVLLAYFFLSVDKRTSLLQNSQNLKKIISEKLSTQTFKVHKGHSETLNVDFKNVRRAARRFVGYTNNIICCVHRTQS